MDVSRYDVRMLIFHEYRNGRKVPEACCLICHSMGPLTVNERTVRKWYREFQNRNYDISDKPHPGASVTIDVDRLLEVIEDDPRLSSRELAKEFGCSHVTITHHLKEIGKSWKCGKWSPHELDESQQVRRIDACTENLTSHRSPAWLTNLVTGDETWTLYVNHTRRHQWLGKRDPGFTTPKPSE